MDTKRYYRQLRAIAVLAVCCSLIWLYWTFGRMYVVVNDPPSVTPGCEYVPLSVAYGYAFLSLILVGILGIFLYSQIRSLKNGVIFSKRCQYSLFSWAAVWPFYDICGTNMSYIQSHDSFHVFSIEGSAVGITIIIFTFAVLYRIARQVAEENQLTI